MAGVLQKICIKPVDILFRAFNDLKEDFPLCHQDPGYVVFRIFFRCLMGKLYNFVVRHIACKAAYIRYPLKHVCLLRVGVSEL